MLNVTCAQIKPFLLSLAYAKREITVVETVNPSAFARPPTCFKAYLAWMFSLPKFPDPSTWPWWLSIWLWWLEDGIFSELKGYMGNKENEGKMNVAVDYSIFVSSY